MESTPRQVKTVQRTIQILDALVELNGAGVTELADYLDLSKGGVYNHLITLKQEELVTKREDVYTVSFKFLNIGAQRRNNCKIYKAGKKEVDTLAERTGLHSQIMVEEFNRGIYIHTKSANCVGEEYHRKKLMEPCPLHLTSSGKAILAFLPKERLEEIITNVGLSSPTETAISDEAELYEELAAIRERGYATVDEEKLAGTRAIGAPVLDEQNTVLGAISVSGPIHKMKGDRFTDELSADVLNTVNNIEISLALDE